MKVHKVSIAFILLFSPLAVSAQSSNYYCKYLSYSNSSGLQIAEETFWLTFVVNRNSGESFMTGNNGTEEVKFIEGSLGAITFIEQTDVGNVMITTITASLESVHSRNSVLFGDLMPSQYYGTCTTL
jgi:hypothetical protein